VSGVGGLEESAEQVVLARADQRAATPGVVLRGLCGQLAAAHQHRGNVRRPLELQPLIDSNGKSKQLFDDVGYGIQGKSIGGGPPARLITWERKISTTRVAPGNGSVSGLFHETWFITQNVPNQFQGGACGGDSGSPVFWHGTTEIVAVHTGGYRLGYNGVLCGRMTSLNHRVDLPEVHDWIMDNTVWAS